MRVLLIQPRRKEGMGFRDLFQVEPFGLEMVAGALQEEEVKIIDLTPKPKIIKQAQAFQPEMCGISCSFTVDVPYALELCRNLKEALPDTFVFVGGHHAATNPEDFHAPYVDAVVTGEGESTVQDMARAYRENISWRELPGLVLNSPQEQYFNEPRPLIRDLDTLPYPARHLVDKYRSHYYHGFRRPVYNLETARGCPYRCKFCSVWKFFKGKYRMKSEERVVEEIKSIPGDSIFITDDNFFSNIHRAEKIASLLKQEGIKKDFIMQIRSDDVVSHPEVVGQWKEVGLNSSFIGFEGVDQEDLEKLNKKNTVANNEKALQMMEENNIGVMASFIIDPDYDRSDFQKMIDYVRQLEIKMPSYSVLTPLPGTELYEEMKNKVTISDYRLFDFLHAVIPTYLPLKEFYRELSSLWSQTYHVGYLTKAGLLSHAWYFAKRPSDIFHAIKMYRGIRRMFNQQSYLWDHMKCQDPSLSESSV